MSISRDLLSQTTHRPWPVSGDPWIMTQTWHDLAFLHWPVAPDEVRRLLPSALPLDLYDGQAWIGIVPFGIRHTRPHGLPPVPGFSDFPEINVRTYVTLEGKPGVYFFSLDINNPLGVWGARLVFHLNYFHARMSYHDGSERISVFSHRVRSVGAEDPPNLPESLEYWLTERYCLYALDRHQCIYRAEIHHWPWPLQPAQAQITVNTMTTPLGITLPGSAPLVHFARWQDVL